MAKPNAEDYIDLKLINDKELQQLFEELIPSVQNKIVLDGMRKSSQLIIGQAKSNFKARKKSTTRTKFEQKQISEGKRKETLKSFTTAPMTRSFGLRVGIKNYVSHWVEWGTDDRSYKKGVKRSVWRKTTDKSGAHNTGKVQPTNFFYDAVASKKEEALKNVSDAIIVSLNKTVARYNKKYS